MVLHLSRSTRLSVVIGISTCFFLAEISRWLPFLGFCGTGLGMISMCWYRASGLLYPFYCSDCRCFPLCKRVWVWSWRLCWLTYIAAEWFSWVYYCSCCIEGTVWFGRRCGGHADVKYRNPSAVTRLRSSPLVGSGRNCSVPFSMVFFCLDWALVYFYSPLSDLSLYNVGAIAQAGFCLIWLWLTVRLDIHDPKLMFIIGCIGLGLNIISVVFLHGRVRGVIFSTMLTVPRTWTWSWTWTQSWP